MEKLATDIYAFRKLREGGYAHVDKTALIRPLVDDSPGAQFFPARPRRFGKSPLVSTLRALSANDHRCQNQEDFVKGRSI